MARPDRDVDGDRGRGADASPPSFPPPFSPTAGFGFGFGFEAGFSLDLGLVWCFF